MEYYIIAALLWYLSGVWGFVWWWTHEYDLTLDEIWFMLIVGLYGPVAWVMGWSIHGKKQFKTVVLKNKSTSTPDRAKEK